MHVSSHQQTHRLSALKRYTGPALLLLLLSLFAFAVPDAFAHGVSDDDKAYIVQNSGMRLLPFIYLGAKHMVTGYDHLLFLFGVIFFLTACAMLGPM